VTFRLPTALSNPDDDSAALVLLRRYYGEVFCGPGSLTGAAFDLWDSTGTRHADCDRFTADDLVAVSFLSVDIPARAAMTLLRDRKDEFNALLVSIGPDRELADEAEPLRDDWAGWQLMHELRDLRDIGPTRASKLVARKRPRLRPIWDSVVAAVTGTHDTQWEPLRVALREQDGALQRRLLRLRDAAGIPAEVSALRVFDVICWREGKDGGL
jgi:Family of unknown function (DUF6308)